MNSQQAASAILRYHAETKHYPQRYARSMGSLDWANQPDPFRRYEGAPLVELPFSSDTSVAYDDLYARGRIAPRKMDRGSLAQFLELSLGLSAWKEYMGGRWALRVNPSSGNLHPTEGYLITGAVDGLCDAPSVFHYAPREHALEQRARFDADTWNDLAKGLPSGACLVGLSSIPWREAWKYGERAFRYCQHDCGHALVALRLSATALGWRLVVLEALSDHDVAGLLGLDRREDFHPEEPEHPELLAAVFPETEASGWKARPTAASIERIAAATWVGRANVLSAERVAWPIIDEAVDASTKPPTEPVERQSLFAPAEEEKTPGAPAARSIILQRRSAVDYDGTTAMPRDPFYRALLRTLPADRPPWDAVAWAPSVHLALFVHRVDGLVPGLYLLVRNPGDETELRSLLRDDFVWDTPPGCPSGLPLVLLGEGDLRLAAAQVSCTQAIAGDSAFSLGMLARFAPVVEREPWMYRRLFWETGMIGQVLYLEAEALGLRATGIGCYFDDPMHRLLGLSDATYQSLYHFTVGGPVDDTRLTTLPPYGEELRLRR